MNGRDPSRTGDVLALLRAAVGPVPDSALESARDLWWLATRAASPPPGDAARPAAGAPAGADDQRSLEDGHR